MKKQKRKGKVFFTSLALIKASGTKFRQIWMIMRFFVLLQIKVEKLNICE